MNARTVIESIYDNGAKIIGGTPIFKSAGIAFNHSVFSVIEKDFGGTQTFGATLKSPGGKALSYAFVAIAWANTAFSIFSKDPIGRANSRGYTLK